MGKEEIQESEPLRIYLNEIGEIPLLDETEEKELAEESQTETNPQERDWKKGIFVSSFLSQNIIREEVCR